MKAKRPSHLISRTERGVALVMTLILLAVITFLAVAFLVLSQRERGATTTATEQTTARQAAEISFERAKGELVVRLLCTTNIFNNGILVSTGYFNPFGFVYDGSANPVPNPTNVNLFTKSDGTPFTAQEWIQNIGNLGYDAIAPVFVSNRFTIGSNDFRHFIDLNRSKRYDPNGMQPVVVDYQGGLYYQASNGTLLPYMANQPVPVGVISNFFTGDPQWRGNLRRPDEVHSADNPFISRSAFIVVPAGNTLDVNYIHNHAKPSQANVDGFFRNQGFGTWEINLAAFLVDLNTNLWLKPPSLAGGYGINITAPYYRYNTNYTFNDGAAFQDAFSLINYRYAAPISAYNVPPLNAQATVLALYGTRGDLAFRTDNFDGYTAGPVMTDYRGLAYQGLTQDPDTPRTALAWAGGFWPQRFFSMQDFFDTTKIPSRPGYDFVERLNIAGTNDSSYNRYTFYRMLEGLGTDSAPEPANKMNLNYDNLVRANPNGIISQTNFYDWEPITFFTNAADRLLTKYSEEWRAENPAFYQAVFATNRAFGVGDIPVWVSNRFVYTPAVHRLLQLAANIYDASTNRTYDTTSTNQFPSVFRPYFRKQGNDIYIAGYKEISKFSATGDPDFNAPRDLENAADMALFQPGDNIYGVPWVIGAKKGLPNFNELTLQSFVQVTRKLQVTRSGYGDPQANGITYTTNMFYAIGISNALGIEAWNSYQNTYARGVDIYLANSLAMALTNEFGYNRNYTTNSAVFMSVPASQWRGYGGPNQNPGLSALSFKVPLCANMLFQLDLPYSYGNAAFVASNNPVAWNPIQSVTPQLPQWQWSLTNKMRFIMVDQASQRVIDYVQLGGPRDNLDFMPKFQQISKDRPLVYRDLWNTNVVNGLAEGINSQIVISRGDPQAEPGTGSDWNDYGSENPQGATRKFRVDEYRAFYHLAPRYGNIVSNKSLSMQVPFSPTMKASMITTWQANDPLVHYTASDLQYLATTNNVSWVDPKGRPPVLENLTNVNQRYQPWGGNQAIGQNSTSDLNPYNLVLKDPLIWRSDDWAFMTNKFVGPGWLGRVHRGTPWQTVYMKASAITNTANDITDWQKWTGNAFRADAIHMGPEADRVLFDIFTTSLGDNASRGQLSVNQPGLPAWSAIFAGTTVLTNTTTDIQLLAQKPAVFSTAIDPSLVGLSEYIQPVGMDGTNSPLYRIWQDINETRRIKYGGSFKHVGDILDVGQLTTNSPFLNLKSVPQVRQGVNDAVYEWLPQQVMGLLQVGQPRFVVYAYGQTLKPAPNSTLTSGPYTGMATNYQVVAEAVTRAVLRIEGSPVPGSSDYPPRVVVESYNLLQTE